VAFIKPIQRVKTPKSVISAVQYLCIKKFTLHSSDLCPYAQLRYYLDDDARSDYPDENAIVKCRRDIFQIDRTLSKMVIVRKWFPFIFNAQGGRFGE